jgi:archaeal preflagellin peptidase FlaK
MCDINIYGMLLELATLVTFVLLFLAARVDWRTGEVPESLSMGLMGFVFVISAGSSIFYWNLDYLIQPVFWGSVAFLISYLIYYLGHWGGGDVKLLGGIGGFIGFLSAAGYAWPNGEFLGTSIPPLVTYAIDMALLSTPFVMLYTLGLGLMRPSVFRVYLKNLMERKVAFTFGISLLPLILAIYMGLDVLAYVYLLVPLMVVSSIYMKTVEDNLMTKTIKVSDLKEWDILADEVYDGDVKVASKGDIEGISPQELGRIRELSAAGKIPEMIRTKKGVEFVPVLFLSLPATLYIGNILEVLFKLLFQAQ